jgi:hypothetical protein
VLETLKKHIEKHRLKHPERPTPPTPSSSPTPTFQIISLEKGSLGEKSEKECIQKNEIQKEKLEVHEEISHLQLNTDPLPPLVSNCSHIEMEHLSKKPDCSESM